MTIVGDQDEDQDEDQSQAGGLGDPSVYIFEKDGKAPNYEPYSNFFGPAPGPNNPVPKPSNNKQQHSGKGNGKNKGIGKSGGIGNNAGGKGTGSNQ